MIKFRIKKYKLDNRETEMDINGWTHCLVHDSPPEDMRFFSLPNRQNFTGYISYSWSVYRVRQIK